MDSVDAGADRRAGADHDDDGEEESDLPSRVKPSDRIVPAVDIRVRSASELTRIGPAEVRERYGVEPAQVVDFIALRGDPSDRLPGAPGVGPKKAADLLRQYGSLEEAIAAGRFTALAEELRLYRRIASLDASAPLPPLPDQTPSWAEASSLLSAWGMNAVAERVAARATRV